MYVCVCVAVSYFFMSVVLTCPVISNRFSCQLAAWFVCVYVHSQWRVQSIGRGQSRDRCENRLSDKNPRHNPLMSMLPSLCDSGHFTLWECVHVPEGVCLSVCSVTQRLWGSSEDIRLYSVLNSERQRQWNGRIEAHMWISLHVAFVHVEARSHASTCACGHVRAWCLGRQERSAISVTLSLECMGPGSHRPCMAAKQGHISTFTFTGCLFIPQGHDVRGSTSAIYLYRHCKPHTGFDPKRTIATALTSLCPTDPSKNKGRIKAFSALLIFRFYTLYQHLFCKLGPLTGKHAF